MKIRTFRWAASPAVLLTVFMAVTAVFVADSATAETNQAAPNPAVSWLPAGLPPPRPVGPKLCRKYYLTPAQGKAVLEAAVKAFPNRKAWTAYADNVRFRIQQGANLYPWPRRTPLHAIVRDKRVHDGYSVENVALETVPGFYVCGNLYRPLGRKGPFPAVLSPHGHTASIKKPSDWKNHGRFTASVQTRAATLARMGAVVMTIDMFGYGDTIQEVGQAAHQTPFAMTIQTWDNIRALDFLQSLKDVDPDKIAVTGESGGGTQTFFLTALDPRVRVSVPVVMVSSYFFGGCPCESGLPVHRSPNHFASNAMIAALAAPRPMLVVSDGHDWTQHVPEASFPFLRKIYSYYHASEDVQNVHLPKEFHNYGPSKRRAMYRFLSEYLGLDLSAIEGPGGKIDESTVTIEPPEKLHVFDSGFPLPANAVHSEAAVERSLKSLQE